MLAHRRLGAAALALSVSTWSCSEDEYDSTSNALDGLRSEMEMIDQAIERATDFAYFHRWEMMPAQEGTLDSDYQDGHWTFSGPGWAVSFAFSTTDGLSQELPGEQTDRMEHTASVDLDAASIFGTPGPSPVSASVTSSSFGMTTSEPYILATHAQDHVVDQDGVHREIHANADADVQISGGCARGNVTGTVTASGETAGERPSTTVLDFEAHYEGRELFWTAFEGTTMIDEGSLLTEAAAGC